MDYTTSQQSNPIDSAAIRAEADELLNLSGQHEHENVLREILEILCPIDFREMASLADGDKLAQKHYRVITIQEVLRVANELGCGLCRNQDFVYSYNGNYWQLLDRNILETFLGEAAARLGVHSITARDFEFKVKLYRQFMADAYLPAPETPTDKVLINLQNGTFEISSGVTKLREFRREDFLTYQLPFAYDPDAVYPKWQQFLDEVLLDVSLQTVLSEYMGYVFARGLKLEKTLLLFGTGANGKSVVFDVMTALFGPENISHYGLDALCGEYYRAMIANRLLNYASEISTRLQAEKFKQLSSGEPIAARLPYGQPMMLTRYARLAFNCNELPRDVEHTEAFFRRFLIIPFDVTIPAERRNPNLAKEIIDSELSGVFNWLLAGLKRLLEQGKFSLCGAADKILENYRKESDSVAMFLDEEGYEKSGLHTAVKDLYVKYKSYCLDNGYSPLGRNNFSKRLQANDIVVKRLDIGQVAFIQR